MDITAKSEKCFVIMPIGDTEGYERGHFSNVYKDLLKPAIENAGYQPERADEIQGSNLIAVDIVEKIWQTPIAICDLSSCNPNVFYELGIRHASTLPVVLIKDRKTNNPFDIKDIRYVEYSENLEYKNVIQTQAEISTVIEKTMADYNHGRCKNSIVALMKSRIHNVDNNHSYTNSAFIENEAKQIADMIDKGYSSFDNDTLFSLILKFADLCRNYPNGISFYNYLTMKYKHKYPHDFRSMLLPNFKF